MKRPRPDSGCSGTEKQGLYVRSIMFYIDVLRTFLHFKAHKLLFH